MTTAIWTALKAHPHMAWCEKPADHPDQLIHAATAGSHRAACGMIVAFIGDPWPDPTIVTPTPRCSICTGAAQAAWKDASPHP